MPRIEEAVRGTKWSSASWPLAGIADERIAPVLLPQVYGQMRRATLWVQEWQRQHGQATTPVGRLLYRYALILDLFLLHDQDASKGHLMVTNCAAMECVCRDFYGILKAYEDVGPQGDPHKKKIKNKARDQYDVAALWDFGPICKEADKSVTKTVRDSGVLLKALGPGGAD